MSKRIGNSRSRSRRKIWAKRRLRLNNSLQQRQEDPSYKLFGFLLKNSPKSKSSAPKKREKVSQKRMTSELLQRRKETFLIHEQGKASKKTQTPRKKKMRRSLINRAPNPL